MWRRAREAYLSSCLTPTFKSGRSSVMVWGAFSGFDKSHVVIMPEHERAAFHFVENVYEGFLSGFYFMHDNPKKLRMGPHPS